MGTILTDPPGVSYHFICLQYECYTVSLHCKWPLRAGLFFQDNRKRDKRKCPLFGGVLLAEGPHIAGTVELRNAAKSRVCSNHAPQTRSQTHKKMT